MLRLKTQEDTSVILPRLKKTNSSSLLETHKISKNINSSIFHSVRNSKINLDPKFVSFQKENTNNDSFLSYMNKLNSSSVGDLSQSRMEWEHFESRLRKYCDIQNNKLY